MDKLSGDQKAEYATSLAALALYDGGADITSDQINTLLDATGCSTNVPAYLPIIFANFLTAERISKMIITPATGGGGGGGGDGGDAGGAAAVKEVEEEVEEAPPAVDMFGGGDGGGDY